MFSDPILAMDLIDIGANLGHEGFDHDLDAVLARARAAGVNRLVVTGASRAGSVRALELAKAHPGVLYATAIYLILRRAIVKLVIGLVLLSNAANLLIFTSSGLNWRSISFCVLMLKPVPILPV